MTAVVLGIINEATKLVILKKIYVESKKKLNVSKLARGLVKD